MIRGADWRDWSPGDRPEELSVALFAGALTVFRNLPPLDALCNRARTILEETFGVDDPPAAESALSPQAFRKAAVAARRAVAGDDALAGHWRALLAAIGFDPETLYLDRLRARVVPCSPAHRNRFARPLAAHRDSWGSGIPAQVNWWLPLYPVAETRTMIVWPDLFGRPVANDAGAWDFEELRSRLAQDPETGYPSLPTASNPPDPETGLPVLLEPGEMLAFSAAHLHAGRSDDSGLCRLGLDTRTVWTDDLACGRQAREVDGRGGKKHWEWFTAPGGDAAAGSGRPDGVARKAADRGRKP